MKNKFDLYSKFIGYNALKVEKFFIIQMTCVIVNLYYK